MNGIIRSLKHKEKGENMTQKPYSFKYDAHTDSLIIYFGTAPRFYSEEPSAGIYTIHDEETEDLIGIEILDYSVRHPKRLAEQFPFIDFSVIDSDRLSKES